MSLNPTPKHTSAIIKGLNPKILNYILGAALTIVLLISVVVLTFQYVQNRKLQTILEGESAKITYQKTQKDQIRDIWEDQARLNDDLTRAQIELTKSVVDYQQVLTANIYINKQANKFEINKAADTSKVIQAQQRVYDALSIVEQKLNDNADKKKDYSNKINTLYQDAGEVQTRRTN